MSLTKYPVISPSGAEYRVTISDGVIENYPEFDIYGFIVVLYQRRYSGFLHRLFRVKRVWDESYVDGFERQFAEPMRGLVETTVHRYETRMVPTDIDRQFREWDGVIRAE